MALVNVLRAILADPVRLVQWFALCRHAGVLLSSVVVAQSLTIRQVGIFEMLLFCGYLCTFFWSDAMVKGYMARYGSAGDDRNAASFFWIHTLLACVVMLLLWIGRHQFIPFLTGQPSLEGLAWFALYQVLVAAVWIAPFTGMINVKALRWFSGYVLFGPSIAIFIAFRIDPALTSVLKGLVVYALLGWIGCLVTVMKPGMTALKEVMTGVWKVSWPLLLYAVSSGVSKSVDSWLVAHQFDESMFAIFRYGAREFPLVVALAGGLSTMMIARLIRPEGLSELRVRTTRLMHICYPAVALLMLSSTLLFEFVFGESFRAAASIFNIYLLLTLTQLMFPQSVLMARNDNLVLWYVSLAELVVNVIASLILLSYFGLVGIAFGTVIAFVFEKMLLFLIARRKYGVRPFDVFHPWVWTGYAVMILICFAISV